MKTNNNKKSFTLVEILVVVAIIGLLATIIMINLSGIGEKGNNARRMQDLRSLHTALTSYNFNQLPRHFPMHTTAAPLYEPVLDSTYIQKIPTDPDPVDVGYVYVAYEKNGTTVCTAAANCKLFALCVKLEPSSSNKQFFCDKGGCKERTTGNCTKTAGSLPVPPAS